MDTRRVYYDHEPAYRKIEAAGGRAWDDRFPAKTGDSYASFQFFLESGFVLPPGPGISALDLGCGGGQVAVMLAERGYTTYGVDYSMTAIQLAERNARDAGATVHFSVGDCLGLDSFENEAMDLVVDNHVLHCLIGTEDRMGFLRSAYRVLKPGGILFSETMSSEGDFDAAAVGADPATRIARNHTRYWVTLSELNSELASAGFRVIHQGVTLGRSSDIVTYAQRPVNDRG
jgi:SAM-dependent methyltransferase